MNYPIIKGRLKVKDLSGTAPARSSSSMYCSNQDSKFLTDCSYLSGYGFNNK